MRGIVVMNKKYPAYVLLILNLILQIASCFWYRELPGFVWVLTSAIVILIPLLFGLRMGLLGLLPVAASELVWFHKLGNVGPLLNLVAFAMAVILMAVAHQWLAKLPRRNRAVLSGVLFITVFAGRELLYQGLRVLVLQKSVNWDTFFAQVFSPVILAVLIMLVVSVDRLDRES